MIDKQADKGSGWWCFGESLCGMWGPFRRQLVLVHRGVSEAPCFSCLIRLFVRFRILSIYYILSWLKKLKNQPPSKGPSIGVANRCVLRAMHPTRSIIRSGMDGLLGPSNPPVSLSGGCWRSDRNGSLSKSTRKVTAKPTFSARPAYMVMPLL